MLESEKIMAEEIQFELCSTEIDCAAVYDHFTEMYEDNGLEPPNFTLFLARLERREIVVGKNPSGQIVCFYCFHVTDKKVGTHIVVYVSPQYRGDGIAVRMCNFTLPIIQSRGAERLRIYSIPRDDIDALQRTRGMTFVEQQTINGVTYNVYERTFD
jgi:GNAT superfamily N-acetyltransferase